MGPALAVAFWPTSCPSALARGVCHVAPRLAWSPLFHHGLVAFTSPQKPPLPPLGQSHHDLQLPPLTMLVRLLKLDAPALFSEVSLPGLCREYYLTRDLSWLCCLFLHWRVRLLLSAWGLRAESHAASSAPPLPKPGSWSFQNGRRSFSMSSGVSRRCMRLNWH